MRLQLLERMLLPLARVLAIELVMALKQLALERIRIPSAETIAVAAASMSKRFYWLAPGLAGIARGAARSVAAFAGAADYNSFPNLYNVSKTLNSLFTLLSTLLCAVTGNNSFIVVRCLSSREISTFL